MKRVVPSLLILIALAVITTVGGSYYTVGAGERAVVLRLGAIEGVTGPGLHFKLPFIETVSKVSTRVAFIEWSKAHSNSMEAYSRDQQPANLEVKMALRVKADDKSIIDLYTTYRDFNGFAESIAVPRTLEGVKTVFG